MIIFPFVTGVIEAAPLAVDAFLLAEGVTSIGVEELTPE
jgi:hypothetical protein